MCFLEQVAGKIKLLTADPDFEVLVRSLRIARHKTALLESASRELVLDEQEVKDHASFWLSQLCLPNKLNVGLFDKILSEIETAEFVVERAVAQKMRVVHYAVKGTLARICAQHVQCTCGHAIQRSGRLSARRGRALPLRAEAHPQEGH